MEGCSWSLYLQGRKVKTKIVCLMILCIVLSVFKKIECFRKFSPSAMDLAARVFINFSVKK